MSFVFHYRPYSVPRPIWSLHGRQSRPQPVIPITIVGPGNSYLDFALLDTGADDTVFPLHVAHAIGVDLTSAPVGSASGFGTISAASLRYAEVTLRLSDGVDVCEWRARVGFTSSQLRRPLLGFAGVLQFFTATFDGERERVELAVNGRYPGI